MTTHQCGQFDDYVAGILPDAEQAGFEQHLQTCPDCRRSLSSQSYVDRLLDRAADLAEPLPSGLADRVEARIRRHVRRRRMCVAAAALSAAAACVVLSFQLVRPDQQLEESRPTIAMPQVPASVEVAVETSEDVIAVPIATDNPNVTIIWLYPVMKLTTNDHEGQGRLPDGREKLTQRSPS